MNNNCRTDGICPPRILHPNSSLHDAPLSPDPPLRQTAARREAQAHPRRLFEHNWVEWLTTSSRAASDEGLRQVIAFVLDRGMIDPRPEARPQTVEAAKELLRQALAIYEVAAASEEGTELDDA